MHNGEIMKSIIKDEIRKAFGKKGMSTESVIVALGLTAAVLFVLFLILSDSNSGIRELIRTIFG
jgi:hypothetical protein